LNKTIGFALCGSYCSFDKVIPQMQTLISLGYSIIPIMSETAYNTDTRFGLSNDFHNKITSICNHEILHSIQQCEPIGPKNLIDILIIAPCTGNTLAKLANGINDSCITMAAKSHLRNNKPVVLAISTNDALSTSAQNIGKLLNAKNIFFVPFKQDDYINKPNSIVCDMKLIPDTISMAMQYKQIQPILT